VDCYNILISIQGLDNELLHNHVQYIQYYSTFWVMELFFVVIVRITVQYIGSRIRTDVGVPDCYTCLGTVAYSYIGDMDS
jgi:hypothetical protein